MLLDDFSSLPSCLVTATDTDAGKTYVACQILSAWQQAGYSVAAFKPLASGAIWQNGQLVSEDAQALAQVTGQSLTEINPYVFAAPASPHIADTQRLFDMPTTLEALGQLQQQYDRVLVEGVGGWCVPLSEDWMLKDLAIAMQLPVVMVARIGLGCINHSLLTIQQINRDCDLYHGWIANQLDPGFVDAAANIKAIQDRS